MSGRVLSPAEEFGLSAVELVELETVEHLLAWFRTVREGVNAGRGGGRFGSPWFEMHEWWHEGSFEDLERHLASMRRFRLDQFFAGYPVIELRRHVDWWWLDAERKAVENTRSERCRGGGCRHCRGGRKVTNGHHTWGTGTFTLSVVRDVRADRVRAEMGAIYLLTRFQHEGVTPRLPDELWRMVRGLPERVARGA